MLPHLTMLTACPQPPSMFNWMSFNPILPKPTIRYGGQVSNILKVAAQDTVLTVNKVDGGKTTFPVQSGMEIDIHVPGLHYNRTLSGFLYHGDKFS